MAKKKVRKKPTSKKASSKRVVKKKSARKKTVKKKKTRTLAKPDVQTENLLDNDELQLHKEKLSHRKRVVPEETNNDSAFGFFGSLEGPQVSEEYDSELDEITDDDAAHELVRSKILEGYDAFKVSYDILSKINDLPKFYVYKDGDYLALEKYPFSWDKALKKYRAGQFKIHIKSSKTGRFITSLVQSVGSIDENFDDDEERKSAQTQVQQFPNFGLDIGDMMRQTTTAYQSLLKDKKSEEREERKLELENTKSQTNLIIETNKMNMQMMMDMNKSQAESMKAIQSGFSEVLKEFKTDTEKRFEQQQKEVERRDERFLKMFESLADAIDSGNDKEEPDFFEQFERIERIRKMLAPEKESGDWKQEIAKNMLPVLSGAAKMAAQSNMAQTNTPPLPQAGNAPQVPQAQQVPQEHQMSEATRKAYERIQNRKESFPLGDIDTKNEKERKTMPRKIENGEQWDNERKIRDKDWGQSVDPNTGKRVNIPEGEQWRDRDPVTGQHRGVPVADDWDNEKGRSKSVPLNEKEWGEEVGSKKEKPIDVDEWGERQGQPNNQNETQLNGQKAQISENDKKNIILNTALPIITDELMKYNPAYNAADRVLQALTVHRLGSNDVLKHFSLEDMLQMRTDNNLPLEVDEWLRKFHECIEKTSRPAQPGRGQSSISDSVQAQQR